MDEIIIALIKSELTAAEAAYEANPCENIEKWWDSLECQCTQIYPLKTAQTA